MYNQGLRICNTQTTHLPINLMTINTQQPLLYDMWYTTPQWLLEEQSWVTDDEDTAEQWWNSQHTDCDVPF